MFLIKELQLQNGKMINWHWDGTPIHLIGPNGCGKSLLLKNLADLFPAKYETFQYLNRTREKHNPEIYRSEVLYLPAQTSMNECLTVEEFMNQPWKFEIYESHKPVYDFKSLLDEWKLTNQLTQKLSSGEKQILSILRALTLKAKVILIDETFAHIDSTKKKKLIELLLDWRLHHHGSYILVSHEVSGFSCLELKTQNFSDLIANPH
jgi:ABC-type iron transport system FetAB ATPase subunit